MLDQLLNSNQDRIKWAAAQAQKFEDQYKNNELSAVEYKELLEDLKRDEVICKLGADLQDKILLEQALNALIAVAGAI